MRKQMSIWKSYDRNIIARISFTNMEQFSSKGIGIFKINLILINSIFSHFIFVIHRPIFFFGLYLCQLLFFKCFTFNYIVHVLWTAIYINNILYFPCTLPAPWAILRNRYGILQMLIIINCCFILSKCQGFHGAIKGNIEGINSTEDIVEPKLPTKYPRLPGYRPEQADNPYNAW